MGAALRLQEDGRRVFEVTFRFAGARDETREYPMADSAEDARRVVELRYGCDVMIDNIRPV
jgi:hypothetical protein